MFNTLNVRGQGLLTGQGYQSHDFVYLFQSQWHLSYHWWRNIDFDSFVHWQEISERCMLKIQRESLHFEYFSNFNLVLFYISNSKVCCDWKF